MLLMLNTNRDTFALPEVNEEGPPQRHKNAKRDRSLVVEHAGKLVNQSVPIVYIHYAKHHSRTSKAAQIESRFQYAHVSQRGHMVIFEAHSCSLSYK